MQGNPPLLRYQRHQLDHAKSAQHPAISAVQTPTAPDVLMAPRQNPNIKRLFFTEKHMTVLDAKPKPSRPDMVRHALIRAATVHSQTSANHINRAALHLLHPSFSTSILHVPSSVLVLTTCTHPALRTLPLRPGSAPSFYDSSELSRLVLVGPTQIAVPLRPGAHK